MRTISLWQPWASLIAHGFKCNETRSWYTPYHGPLAIHAAKRFAADERELCETEPFKRCLIAAGYVNQYGRLDLATLELGMVVATCRLAGCLQTDGLKLTTTQERAFGNYAPGRFAWLLEDVVALEPPVPAKGTQGFWQWEPAV